MSNGGYRVRDWCDNCCRSANSQRPFISAKYINNFIKLPDFPYSPLDVCEVCGNTERVELHHFAPVHLFGSDAERWPKAYLCGDCHSLWHKLVTPNMNRIKYELQPTLP